LGGKKVFDLGCFTGGRAVYWAEKYGFKEISGVDINPIFARAGKLFAKKKNIQANFLVGTGEFLPLASESFDTIISYDVFEHVQDVEKALNECFRILKPDGKIFIVFPPIYQPLESHLGCVTKIPALNLLFSGKTIIKAYQEIIQERGPEAYWYIRKNWELENWEKFPCLNGITVSRFRKLIKKNKDWQLEFWSREPIFSSGRTSKKIIFRLFRFLFFIPAHLPILEEFFLDRICCLLVKRSK
jgi:SAM-dependent methyltransferase